MSPPSIICQFVLNYIYQAIRLISLSMNRKKIDKKIPRLESTFHNVLVCKKTDCRPFLEVLIEEPENISHQNLGTLVGIFQIDDRSEDSSYVVNYLISIIKKEYFSHTSRGSVENFEAALHKANLALAKLATHENIGWIGKINALCAVIEKNNLLLSQTGNASAFLLRGAMLAEITEAPLEETDSNPLKTFQDVISGKIEKDDKLIFTTKELFDIFSLEEIKKSALKFSRENFIQFLNTALVNELDQVATLVVDISEKTAEIVESPAAKRLEKTNVFSQTAFQKELSPKMLERERAKEEKVKKERQEMIQELKEDAKDFVDKKTGHIYIKEPRDFPAEDLAKKPGIDFTPLKEKIAKLSFASFSRLKSAGKKTKLFSLLLWQKSATKISQIRLKPKATPPDIPLKKEFAIEPKLKKEIPVIKEMGTAMSEKLKTAFSKLELKTKALTVWELTKKSASRLEDETIAGLIWLLRKPTKLLLFSTALMRRKWQARQTEKTAKSYTAKDAKRYPWEKIAPDSQGEKSPLATPTESTDPGKLVEMKKILPDFSRLKKIIRGLDRKQKIFALVALALLLVVPYWIVRWENTPKTKPAPISEAPPIIVPLEKDLAVSRVEKLTEVYAGNVTKISNLNNKFFAQTETDIIDLENQKTIPLPSDFQNPELFFPMDDLNLLFLVKNNRVTALAPTTGKFTPNNLAFPENANVVAAQTYLTYAYLFDAKNNQLYRYPRAEGGFGGKTAWLKEDLVLTDAKSLAINENVFLASENEIQKLFRGKKVAFSIEKTATPIKFTKLFAKRDSGNLYVLDKVNARVVKLDNEGKILAQYYNAKIAEADDFSVNEENNLVYLSTKRGVESFEMNR
jgi:hypothetical protein